MNATQTWFITGTSSGFGRAFAEHALARGHRVVATARSVDSLAGLVAQAPDRVLAVALDVNVAGAAEAAIAAAVARFGRIDVLVNNAGYGVVGALEETPDAELRALFETNFFGAMAVIRAALPVLREQRSGAIVNMSSLGGQLSFAGFSAYSATKFALEGASEALAQEMALPRINDPVVLHAEREIACRFRHAVVPGIRRRQNLNDQQRRTFDAALRKLRGVGHHHQIRFCHVVLAEDHAQGSEEDFAQTFPFEKLVELTKETLRDVLVRKRGGGIHIQLSRQQLVLLPVVGQREVVVGRDQRPGLHGLSSHESSPAGKDDDIVARGMQRLPPDLGD